MSLTGSIRYDGRYHGSCNSGIRTDCRLAQNLASERYQVFGVAIRQGNKCGGFIPVMGLRAPIFLASRVFLSAVGCPVPLIECLSRGRADNTPDGFQHLDDIAS